MPRPDPDVSVPHEVDFQHIPTGGFFAECTQPNRTVAEAFALDKLIELGEDPDEAAPAVALAGYTAADARTYAVRIYPTTPPRRTTPGDGHDSTRET